MTDREIKEDDFWGESEAMREYRKYILPRTQALARYLESKARDIFPTGKLLNLKKDK